MVGKGSGAEQDADDVEAALFHVMFDAMLHETVLAFKQAGESMNMYGYAVIEGPMLHMRDRPEPPIRDDYDDDETFEWAEIDFKNSRRSWNPLRFRAPHPSRVLMDPYERNPSIAVIRERLSVKDIRGLLEELRENDLEGIDVNEQIALPDENYRRLVVAERWSADWHSMHLGADGDALGEQLFIEPNVWGFVPYVHGFAGFGQEKTDEDTDGSPLTLAQGLLDGVLSSLRVQAQSFSAKHYALIVRSYLRMTVNPDKADSAEIAEQIAQEDAIMEVDPEAIDFLKYPAWERGLLEIDKVVEGDITLGTFVQDVAGVRQQGVSTVGQQAILSMAGHRKFEPVLRQLNYMATVLGRNTLRLVDRMQEDITANGHTLKVSQIRNDYNIIAEFEVVDAALQQNARELGLREVEAGIKSHQSYRENDLRVANESEEKKRLQKELVRRSPAYLRAIARAIAMEDGMLDAIENFDTDEQTMEAVGEEQEAVDPRQISDMAGGGAARSLRQPLNAQTTNPRRVRPTAPPRGR